jgi:hypothetical protein
MTIARVLSTEERRAPEGFERQASRAGVQVSWRSRGHGTCVIAGSLGLALGALLLAAASLASQMAPGLVAVAVTVASAYLLPVGLLNRTILCLGNTFVAVKQRPLPCPWPSWFQATRRKVRTLDIYEVSVEEVQAPTRHRGQGPTYSLAVRTISTGWEVFLTRLSRDEAAFLEREINAFLR